MKYTKHLGVITKSNKPLPNDLKNYTVDSESLNQYIGVYKPKDSVRSKTSIIINEKGLFLGKDKFILFHEGNDKFGFEFRYNMSLTFQRDQMGELTGVNFERYEDKREYKKID